MHNAPRTGYSSVTVTGLNFANTEFAAHRLQHVYQSGGRRTGEAYNTGTRSDVISVTRSAAGWEQPLFLLGSLQGSSAMGLVDGNSKEKVMSYHGVVSSSVWIEFELTSAAIFTGFISRSQKTTGWGGTWAFEGSKNGATWTQLWSGEPSDWNGDPYQFEFVNTESYRFYRFIGVSGISNNPWLYELEFVLTADTCSTLSWSSSSSVACLLGSYLPDIYRSMMVMPLTVAALVGTSHAIDEFTFDGTSF